MNTIASHITNIIDARNELRNKGIELGIATPTDDLQQVVAGFAGTINQGTVNAQVREGETFTIPKGWHNGGGVVSGIRGDGSLLPILQQRTVTPSRTQQEVTPDRGYFGLSSVIVHPIPSHYRDVSGVNVQAGQVLAGVLFVNSHGQILPGTMPNQGNPILELDGMAHDHVIIPQGYHNGFGYITLTDSIEQALAEI